MTGRNRKKTIAAFFLTLLLAQNFYPAAAYALTSGPSQPEMQKFSAAGAGDMVDLFSGDFKYDIPLMDVGGYPLNLTYHSGAEIEDEASWVGVGWTLNPGSVNRTMRGLPDDFTGDNTDGTQDVIQTIQHQKNYTKIGGRVTVKGTVFGWTFGEPSLYLGVYKDNYWGIGAELGASLNFDVDQTNCTTLTAGLKLSTDSKNGVTVTPSFGLTASYEDNTEVNNLSLSGSFKYNTREGLKSINLDQSFGGKPANCSGNASSLGFASFTKDFAHTYTPSFSYNTQNSSTTFSFDAGPTAGVYGGIGGTGYVTTQTNVEPHSTVPAYGYLNYANGRNNPAALLDFNREKDGPYITGAPAIPVPVATEDYFEATSQAGAQEFRPYYNGDYIVYDRPFTNKNSSFDAGVTIGFGDIFQAGGQLSLTSGQGMTHVWPGPDAGGNNQFITYVTPQPPPSPAPYYETVFFKQAGEKTATDMTYYGEIGTNNTEQVGLSGAAGTYPILTTSGAVNTIGMWPPFFGNGAIQSYARRIKTSTFSYLTAQQASLYGLDKKINGQPRVDQTVHKPHHISEITVTDKDGKRMVYGLPVYSTDHEEVSMSVAGKTPGTITFDTARQTGLIPYNAGADNSESNNQGRHNLYNRKIIPPYATSYLLTGILSPDYVDLTGNGITDDDPGTAVKFQYTKSVPYTWRAPYEHDTANYNEGYLSDQSDDKGSYVFGTRENWYLDTIRSKALVAVFYTSARQDGLGVIDENGGRNSSDTLQELDSIRLFSSADLLKNPTGAIPIKVAHFQYDYSLVPVVPNNSGKFVPDPANATNNLNALTGKLTLKKVWFTFGISSRGQTNPYIFSYDMRPISSIPGVNEHQNPNSQEANDQYTQRQTDRWGTYRQNYLTTPTHVFNNSEFPYSSQVTDYGTYDEQLLADRLASKWQLDSITTPTGGIISVQYESDDYSYVQDQKAMIMCPLAGVGAAGSNTGLISTNMLYVTVPVAPASPADFVSTYLSGPNGQNLDNIFYKMSTNIDNKGHYEYVYGYAEIDYSKSFVQGSDPHMYGIPLKTVSGYNPVSVQAWQLLQTDLPQFAYANYDNSNVDNLAGSVVAAVKSIIQAFVNLRELAESFDEMAAGSHYANTVDLSHSVIRLNYPVGKTNGITSAARPTYGKLGGGSRVHSVELSDNWNSMASPGTSISYGIRYDYTMTDDNGHLISSGVASYEPEIGNEENPFHQPMDYTEKVEWGLDRYHFMEKPFGESYFPAPSVGYSQVKATSYGADYSNQQQPVIRMNTGYTLSQFYTARDFPTQVDYLPLQELNYENDLTLLLFAAQYTNRVTTSQGFKVITNDMHGKQKSIQTVDNNGNLITSTQYFYNVNDQNAQEKTLNNTVLALDAYNEIVPSGILIGTDAELVTDMRESSSTDQGTSVGVYPGGMWAFIPIPYVGFNYNASSSLRTYNSASTIKVIHQYGLLQEVRTTQNGSTLTADNLLWDAQTGEVLLTRNQNEFNDYTYTLNYPAHRAYDGMGSAYENLGGIFSGFQTDAGGTLAGTPYDPALYNTYLSPGDELVDIDPNTYSHGWLMQSANGTFHFIDSTGNFIANANGTYMVVRSGRRNMLNASAGSVVMMNNPLVAGGAGYILQDNVNQNILDAKAVAYKDEWGAPVPNFLTASSHQSYTLPPFFQPGIPDYNVTNSGSPPTSDCSGYTFQASVARGGLLSNAQPLSTAQPLSIVQPLSTVTRGFIDYGADPYGNAQPPAGSVLNSVTLTLTSPTGTTNNPTGLSAAYIERVTQEISCGGVTAWPQPQVTTSNWVAVPAMSTTNAAGNQTFVMDITAMYNEWANMAQKDDPDFAVAIVLADETTQLSRGLVFEGPFYSDGPTLTFNYGIPGQCTNPVNQVFNPYYAGVKGNWRPQYNYAYLSDRMQTPGDPSQIGGTNIRTSGYYSSYTPFWLYNFNNSTDSWVLTPIAPVPGSPGVVADPRWVWSTQSVYYDQKGNEIESTDALNRYSAVLFGYDQSLPTGVAANARRNEIAFEGFEDYYFNLLNTATIPCPLTNRQLNMGFTLQGDQYCNSGGCIANSPAAPTHTGNYSYNLTGTLNLAAPAGSATPPSQFLGFDAAGHGILLANEQAAGFAPIPGKQYLLSLWVYDGDSASNLINGLQVNINGNNIDLSAKTVPVVENWKQLNITFTAGPSFNLQLNGSGNIYIDDLRLLPFNGEMKNFVYDDQSLRLMGQLDENNFGVLYEYDEEGTPIRTKKETERGIMTVNENRQSLVPH